jgi:hypothetical protein
MAYRFAGNAWEIRTAATAKQHNQPGAGKAAPEDVETLPAIPGEHDLSV